MHNRAGVVCGVMLILSLTACASPRLEAARMPGAELTGIKTIYVQKLAADERGIDHIIADTLSKMGFIAHAGLYDSTADAVVTYQDRWMWDLTMFLMQLTIQVRDGRTGLVLANGQSWRPSLQRTSPEDMAHEVLTAIFHGKGD